jgi:hypothetical protein
MAREAGLPPLIGDDRAERHLLLGSKGVVRAVYPDLNRVDIETEEGSLLTKVMVLGPYFPEIHQDNDRPSHVAYLHVRGAADAICWPITFRRLLSPTDPVPQGDGDTPPERRRYDTHHYIHRNGDMTIRITRDNRVVIESEKGDYFQLDQDAREVRIHAPSVFLNTEDGVRVEVQRDDEYIKGIATHVYVGTDTATRIQYDQDDQIQMVMNKIFLGATGLQDQDGITYLAGAIIHLVSSVIKLTASSQIVLDPAQVLLGSNGADQQVILGNLFMAFLNTFLTLFNGHTHTGVQGGGGTSGAPTTSTPLMDTSVLSDAVFASKTGGLS